MIYDRHSYDAEKRRALERWAERLAEIVEPKTKVRQVDGGKQWVPAAQARLRFRWQELGGPPVAPPKRHGFGSRFLEELLAHELALLWQIDSRCYPAPIHLRQCGHR